MVVAAKSAVDPRRYFEGVPTGSNRPAHDPVCLYLETTNRCNLLCTTCPRTYEELEPPADMGWREPDRSRRRHRRIPWHHLRRLWRGFRAGDESEAQR